MEPQSQHAHYTVAVRIRPNCSNSSDVFMAHQSRFVKQLKEKSILTYCFDKVYQPEQNNLEIYEDSVRKTVRHFLFDKVNTTFLAYGQTGSGKTYTLFGHQDQIKENQSKGLAEFIAQQICAQLIINSKISIACSFIQVYKQKVTDLINGMQINLRQNREADLNLQNQSVSKVDSLEQLMKLFHQANSNKIFGNSYVHSQSSRSHVIFTIHMTHEGNKNATKLNIVDLCGSQLLTYQFDEKQRSETNSINLSLFTLNNVISDLCDNKKNRERKFVAFRNSVLTRILKSSLINVRKTQVYLFCNMSPQKQHQEFSSSTLRFGQLAIQIDENQNYKGEQKVNLSQQKRQQKKVSNIIELSPKPLKQFCRMERKWETQKVVILNNRIKVYRVISENQCSTNILILHAYGYGCAGDNWDTLVAQFLMVFPNCNLFSVDLPGFGESSGQKFTSRAEKFNEKGQPIQFMLELFKMFKFNPKNKVILLGYDLGGAIALSCSLHQSLNKSICACIVFHPTWTDSIEKLAMISLPVLLIWVTVQTFHLVSAGTKMSKVIKCSTLYKLNIGPYTQEKSSGYYDLYSDTIAKIIIQFIQSIRPTNQENHESKKGRGKVMEQEIVVDINKEQQKLLMFQQSVSRFYGLLDKKTHKDIFEDIIKGGQNKPKAVRLASQLPTLDVSTLSFDNLISWGIIQSGPRGRIQWDIIPMLPVGRQIQVKTNINLSVLHGPHAYLAHVNSDSNIKGEHGVTHRASISPNQTQQQILNIGQVKILISLPDQRKIQIPVKLDEVIMLNSATIFRKNQANNSVVFQDSVYCKYESNIVKLKMVECFYSIRHLIPQMDFNKNDETLLNLQKQCTKRIYKLIDLKHLVHEGIDNTRFTGLDVGRLAYYGQGNCHHLASVTAAFLLPFGKLLGWEVIFRAGSFFKTGSQVNDQTGQPVPGWDGRPNVKVEDHTWLEVVYKPSFHLTVFDPSFDICSIPVDEIYTFRGKMHISDRWQCGALQPQIPSYLFDNQYSAL